MPAARCLWLFDIDGTLILGNGAGEQALRAGMRKAFGRDENFGRVRLAGATDRQIALDLLREHHLPQTPENIAALLEAYLESLPAMLPERGGHLVPGILEVLEALHRRPERGVLGLLTGNLRRGAQLKLTHFGIWHYFPFGAFADDHHDRNELGPVACQRALEYHGEIFPPERIYVIGDTPKDIACGKAIGARTVALATSAYTKEQLAEHHPDYLLCGYSEVCRLPGILLEENT